MASKTIDHMSFYVDVTPYQHETASDQTFNALDVSVAYRKGQGFVVYYHPGWKSGLGFGCLFDFSKDPLTAGHTMLVEPATKNNVKRLTAMHEALKLAEEGIRAYFDARDFAIFDIFLKSVAKCGYTADFEKQVKAFINKQNNTTMATVDMNETKNVQTAAQVMNTASPAIEDAQAEEIESVSVGEMTIDAIQPAMTAPVSEPEPAAPTKQEVAAAIVKAANEGKATTMPLSKHGTLIIASGGGEKPKPQMPKRDKNGKFLKKGEQPQAEEKPKVTLRTKTTDETKRSYTVVLLPAKSGGVWPKMYGFRSEKDAKAMAEKMPSSVTARWDYGQNGEGRETKTKHWYLTGGKRYCGVMQELVDALNKGDRVTVANVAAKACGVYAAVVADGKQNDKKGETKKAAQDLKPANLKPETKVYTEQEVADLMQRVLKGDAQALAQVNTMLKAA